LSDKNMSLTTISLELQISYGYLSGVFKREEGQSFSSYLVKRRMEKAAELLSRHDMKLYEVADACGYGNYRYFSDSFRKYWGRIPSEFQGV
ncbi:MAG: helix-turn-helix transcriptional regulator, partial [Sphaerochaetaceae bacterium]